jgi:LysR family transcriptional regulator (chromosome initiation inhibitor)
MLNLDPAHLATLAAIHRRGSFEGAAAALGLTPSAVSQRIKALEERMGCLLVRRAVPCTATAPGLRLIRHHDDLSALESALAADLRIGNAGPVTVRLAVNADSLATWVVPALAQVEGVLFDLVIDDQAHSQDWLRRGEVAAAITSHPGPLQGCDTLALGSLRYHATASPGFVARWLGQGVTPRTMAQAPALVFNDKDTLQADWLARVLGEVPGFPAHRIASAQGFVDAALAGLGWGMNPAGLVAGHLAAGRLVDLVPGAVLDVALHWQFARLSAPMLAPVTQALRQAAAGALVQPGGCPPRP